MLFHNVAIDAMAYELPPHRITSAELEEQIAETMARLGIEKGKIERPTGIRERRVWDPGVTPSEVATMVGRKVIEKSGIDSNEIGCLISTSITKDYVEPSVASLIHGNLKLSSRCINFDITNACLGFLDGINTISLMIESEVIKYGLVVSETVYAKAWKQRSSFCNHPMSPTKYSMITLLHLRSAMALWRCY